MKYYLKLNNKGSILQIILVIFLILISFLNIHIALLKSHSYTLQDIQILMKQKNLEIMLIKYYIDTIENDILFDDSIETDKYSIEYEVEDTDLGYCIYTHVSFAQIKYQFLTEINEQTYQVTKFKYLEES